MLEKYFIEKNNCDNIFLFEIFFVKWLKLATKKLRSDLKLVQLNQKYV